MRAAPRADTTSLALSATVAVPQLGLTALVPALPAITRDLGGGAGAAQGTITAYLLGFALAMPLSGLLAERFGPRRVMVWGLALFGAASLLCAAAPTIDTLAALRFPQGLGGCSATLLTRLIVVRDLPERRHVPLFSLLASVTALTPCAAPLFGGWLTQYGGWRAALVMVALLGAGAALLFVRTVPDSQQAYQVAELSVREALADYRRALREPSFRLCVTAISVAWMAYCAFLAGSAPVLEGAALGLSPGAYGALVALVAFGYVAGSLTARRLIERAGTAALLRSASLVVLSGGVLLLAGAALAPTSIWAVAGPAAVVLAGVGLTVPAAQLGALRGRGGNASGLFFFLQMLAGAFAGWATGLRPPGSPFALAVLVAVPCCALPLLVRSPRRPVLPGSPS
ncbi:MFS transporter [Streptomyces sp. NPDC048111]|uniref:MFS transporter n=1 Tax=Streptomyces sp. NPDC048111 TaxID=3365500 RepID=UPI00371CBDF5